MSANLSASILARLLALARQRGDDYSLLLNRFAMERLLARISASPYADHFLLKGALLDDLLWPPTQVAASHSQATATWSPGALRWV